MQEGHFGPLRLVRVGMLMRYMLQCDDDIPRPKKIYSTISNLIYTDIQTKLLANPTRRGGGHHASSPAPNW